jgi:Mce-associated membrane protein
MAEHDGAAEETESVAAPELVDEARAEDSEADDAEETDAEAGKRNRVREWFSGVPKPIAVGIATIVALLGLGGWLGFRVHQDNQVQAQRNLYVQVARQTAINLTTIDYTEVDADIKRVLDSATGAFHEEFQNRSQPFVEVVKKVQSKSEGTISEAGLLSYTKDQAQVLVAVAVKTSMAAAPPDQEPRRWRMRLTVDKTGDSAKVSNVEFVP